MALLTHDDEYEGRVQVWRCIGCGRIEGPQQCIGVCQDRKVELVEMEVHARALAEVEDLRREVDGLLALVRRLATVTPREGTHEQTYLALQAQARTLLTGLSRREPWP